MSKILALVLAFCMLCMLSACGSDPAESTQPATDPVASTDGNETSIAGTYRFEYVDPYGDVTTFTLTIKDGGSFNLMTLGAMGSGVYSGTEWTDHGDGTFTTGATDNTLAVDWAGEDGSVTWTIDGAQITPVGYTEPTEFLEKAAFADPTVGAEAVGVYTFAEINDHGSAVPYVVWVNADGTYVIYMNNSFTGLHAYSGDSWSINAESVISFGPASFEGDEPMGSWFDADNGFASAWKLSGDGTCVPVDYTGTVAEVDTASLPVEIYPAGAACVGVYTFGEVNDYGSTVPYVVWINADGTAVVHMNNSFTGLHTYTAEEWSFNDDGTVSIGALSFESDEPMGSWFDADNGYSSAWTVGGGVCSPVGYLGSSASVTADDFSEEAVSTINAF